jgi:Mrp family chromosome partitioning ATPase
VSPATPDSTAPAAETVYVEQDSTAAPVAQARASHEASPDAFTARDLKKIVEVDFDRLRAAGRLPPKHANHQTEEEIRRIKWPLLSALAGRGGSPPARNNVVLVTSAEPSEGKSYTSMNLALSIVRDREMRVILVDGDVAFRALPLRWTSTGRRASTTPWTAPT